MSDPERSPPNGQTPHNGCNSENVSPLAASSGMATSITGASMTGSTQRLAKRKNNHEDHYAEPACYLEIEVKDPKVEGMGNKRYTLFTVTTQSSLPIFKPHMNGEKVTVYRRYSDFHWLKVQMDDQSHDSKIVVPNMPGQGLTRQFKALINQGEGVLDQGYVESRRRGLELFINRLAGHPLAQNQKSLHMFLFDAEIDKNYSPGIVDRS